MSVLFSSNNDNVVIMRAHNADNHKGNLLSWKDTDIGVTPDGHTWDRFLAGRLVFHFNIANAGSYKLIARVKTGARDCWVWVEVNGHKALIGPRNNGRLLFNQANYRWEDPSDNTFDLEAGNHTITLRNLTGGLEIERVAIVPVGDTTVAMDNTLGPNEIKDDGERYVEEFSYKKWMGDKSRDGKRIILMEFDHPDGTLCIASKPWMSDSGVPYYNAIINEPIFIESVKDNVSVGDIELRIRGELNWFEIDWRGSRCRWFYGDEDWPKSRFQRIAGATIQAARPTSDTTFQFDILGDAQMYNRTFWTGEEETKILGAYDAVNWILGQWENSGSVQFLNVSEQALATQMKFVVNNSSNMYDLIRRICISIGAFPRMTQTGYLEIIAPDMVNEAALLMNEDTILSGTLKVIETIYPVKRIKVRYDIDKEVEVSNEAETGILDEEVIIESLLANATDAMNLATIQAEKYQEIRRVWEAELMNQVNMLQLVDTCNIYYPTLTGRTLISRLHRQPLRLNNKVEFII